MKAARCKGAIAPILPLFHYSTFALSNTNFNGSVIARLSLSGTISSTYKHLDLFHYLPSLLDRIPSANIPPLQLGFEDP